MRKGISLFLLLFVIFMGYSCATAPEPVKKAEEPKEIKELKAPEQPETTKPIPAPTEDEKKSLELFTKVLELVESTNDRKSVLPQMEKLYARIIQEYPDAPLAQESYWKLITIYVEDYTPPAYEKAEALYYQFLKKYPQSYLKGMIEDTLGNSYYKNGKWESLLKLSAPAYQEYVEKGKVPRASLLFMYSEANYHLGNIKEAEKGYKIVAKLFPKLIVGMQAKQRLKKIATEQK